MTLELQPISFSEACAVIATHHRHHLPPHGYKFAIAVNNGKAVVGVATVGRPVARGQDNGWTAEVTRLCTLGTEDSRHAASMLYAACWRAARAMGYKRIITYTLADESGKSLYAAGWRVLGQTKGDTWNRPNRIRVETWPTGPKTLWEAA
jgi:hypothetical protein